MLEESHNPQPLDFLSILQNKNLSFLDSVDPEVHNLTFASEQTSENTHRPFGRYRHETSVGGLLPPNNPYVACDMKRPSSGR